MHNLLACLILAAASSALLDLLDKFSIDLAAADGLHHSKVLEIVVGLEESVPSEEFHENATDTPDIAGETPPQIQYDLRRTIMPGGDD